MATLTVTIPVNSASGGAGEVVRGLARALNQLAVGLPDKNSSGASVVLTLDNGPATGLVSAAITAGPYQQAAIIV